MSGPQIICSLAQTNFTTMISVGKAGEAFKPFVGFMNNSFLYHALTDSPMLEIPRLSQLWTSATCEGEQIKFQIDGVTHTIDSTDVNTALQIEAVQGEVFQEPASEEQLTKFFSVIGYSGPRTSPEGSDWYPSGGMDRKYLRKEWSMIMDAVNRAMSSKTSGWNEIPAYIRKIVHSMVHNYRIDVGKLLMPVFRTVLGKKDGRKPFVYYPRFFMLILNSVVGTINLDNVQCKESPSLKKNTHSILSSKPLNEELGLSITDFMDTIVKRLNLQIIGDFSVFSLSDENGVDLTIPNPHSKPFQGARPSRVSKSVSQGPISSQQDQVSKRKRTTTPRIETCPQEASIEIGQSPMAPCKESAEHVEHTQHEPSSFEDHNTIGLENVDHSSCNYSASHFSNAEAQTMDALFQELDATDHSNPQEPSTHVVEEIAVTASDVVKDNVAVNPPDSNMDKDAVNSPIHDSTSLMDDDSAPISSLLKIKSSISVQGVPAQSLAPRLSEGEKKKKRKRIERSESKRIEGQGNSLAKGEGFEQSQIKKSVPSAKVLDLERTNVRGDEITQKKPKSVRTPKASKPSKQAGERLKSLSHKLSKVAKNLDTVGRNQVKLNTKVANLEEIMNEGFKAILAKMEEFQSASATSTKGEKCPVFVNARVQVEIEMEKAVEVPRSDKEKTQARSQGESQLHLLSSVATGIAEKLGGNKVEKVERPKEKGILINEGKVKPAVISHVSGKGKDKMYSVEHDDLIVQEREDLDDEQASLLMVDENENSKVFEDVKFNERINSLRAQSNRNPKKFSDDMRKTTVEAAVMVSKSNKWVISVRTEGGLSYCVSMGYLQRQEIAVIEAIKLKIKTDKSWLNENLKRILQNLVIEKLPEVVLDPLYIKFSSSVDGKYRSMNLDRVSSCKPKSVKEAFDYFKQLPTTEDRKIVLKVLENELKRLQAKKDAKKTSGKNDGGDDNDGKPDGGAGSSSQANNNGEGSSRAGNKADKNDAVNLVAVNIPKSTVTEPTVNKDSVTVSFKDTVRSDKEENTIMKKKYIKGKACAHRDLYLESFECRVKRPCLGKNGEKNDEETSSKPTTEFEEIVQPLATTMIEAECVDVRRATINNIAETRADQIVKVVVDWSEYRTLKGVKVIYSTGESTDLSYDLKEADYFMTKRLLMIVRGRDVKTHVFRHVLIKKFLELMDTHKFHPLDECKGEEPEPRVFSDGVLFENEDKILEFWSQESWKDKRIDLLEKLVSQLSILPYPEEQKIIPSLITIINHKKNEEYAKKLQHEKTQQCLLRNPDRLIFYNTSGSSEVISFDHLKRLDEHDPHIIELIKSQLLKVTNPEVLDLKNRALDICDSKRKEEREKKKKQEEEIKQTRRNLEKVQKKIKETEIDHKCARLNNQFSAKPGYVSPVQQDPLRMIIDGFEVKAIDFKTLNTALLRRMFRLLTGSRLEAEVSLSKTAAEIIDSREDEDEFGTNTDCTKSSLLQRTDLSRMNMECNSCASPKGQLSYTTHSRIYRYFLTEY
ncbi:hypothetical protein ACET3Z_022371 [Daucus carota]